MRALADTHRDSHATSEYRKVRAIGDLPMTRTLPHGNGTHRKRLIRFLCLFCLCNGEKILLYKGLKNEDIETSFLQAVGRKS